MNSPKDSKVDSSSSSDSIPEYSGILSVNTDIAHSAVDVEFNPAILSDSEVRDFIKQHITTLETSFQKSTFRLQGNACEACALKLEKKITRIPGIRRASATYLGQILTVTFDRSITEPSLIEEDLRSAGANIHPLTPDAAKKPTLVQRIFSGSLNEEISCLLGFLFLISAYFSSKAAVPSAMLTSLLYAAAYIFAGQEGVKSAIASLRQKVLDVDVLMVLAAIGAALINAPFEGALLLFLFSFSNVLQRYAMQRTQQAIQSLLTLRPKEALVKRNSQTLKIPIEDILIGEIIIVRPGEQIPADGILIEGTTSVDESSLTGESIPVAKTNGSPLFAGTINQSGGIELRTTKLASDTTLAHMVRLVAEAQAEKSNTQRLLEHAEQFYAIGVILLTIGIFLFPWIFYGESFSQAFYRAITIMVVASPCALIISTPATVLSAIGGAARRGILIKGGSHLESAAQIDIVAIDKTGTLTFGKPTLTEIITTAGICVVPEASSAAPLPADAQQILRAAAALEAKSEHPLAHAILTSAEKHGLDLPTASNFQATLGKGAQATIENTHYIIGSEKHFLSLNSQQTTALQQQALPYKEMGKTCVWLGTQQGDTTTALAILIMADTLRPSAPPLIENLKKLGVKKVIMLTGDNSIVAYAIAKQAGITEVHAELLPEDKLNTIRMLKSQGTVMMVGDGVNDAPALAMADIGLAMGAAGTDVAMETADVVLMADRLQNIPLLLAHAKRAKRILFQNLLFASSVIIILIIATLGFTLPLPLGVIGHEGSTVLVCLNGLRLLLIAKSPE